MDNKIIIFGSGQFGYNALEFWGYDSVACFCDNNPLLSGTEKYGKPVISFDAMKAGYSDAVIIIAVAGYNAYAILEQCEENGMKDYLIYTHLRETFPKLGRSELLQFISDPLNRMRARKDIYYKRTAELKGQIDYFKRHADIRYIKPAVGELRYRQEQCVRVSKSFFNKIEGLKIRPILDGGNLLGHVRHNGFIPWDDDIDFALIRQEYEKLKTYCRQHIYTVGEWGKKPYTGEKEVPAGMDCYYWYLWHDHFSIVEVREDGYRTGMDFFSLEYYADHYTLGELRVFARQLREDLVCLGSEEEKTQCLERALEKNKKNIADESNSIYFGLDSMAINNSYQREHFIPKNVVFPLKQILWEGEKFWVPNNAEEFLTYEYEDYWNFPEDVGIPLHHGMQAGKI